MAIITVEQVKNYLKINTTSDDVESIIDRLIDRVQKSFESYCNRNFESASYTEYYDGQGSNILVLKQLPITVIDSIYDSTTWIWDAGSLIDSASYRIMDNNSVVFKDTILGNSLQNVKITYTAGYSTSTMPKDIQQACIEETGRKYTHRRDYDVTTKSLEDGSVTYTEKGYLLETKRVLGYYRRLDVI